ncbi:MAG: hypothetical protein HFH86_01515 [Bacilli bacterium]|nr:hypothetical protein [Bacilli bacterium]
MRIFNVLDRKSGNVLISVACYDLKVYKMMMKQFKKMRNVNVSEVKE